MKYTAFISHSNKDLKALHTIREYLESKGYTCFASERDLLHNSGWQAQLVEAMDSSDLLIYLHSKNANDSAEVGREINYFADKCHRPILVYRLDDIAYNRDRSYYLQSINYIDSLLTPSDGLEQLAVNVGHTLKGLEAEKLEQHPGKARIILHRLAIPIIAASLVLVGVLGFHAFEKSKVKRIQQQYMSILSRVDGWIAEEDSLDMILPAIDKAEELYGECSGRLTVKAPEEPDFKALRSQSIQAMSETRTRRINTVKALYEPLKYASRENVAASVGVIENNIAIILQLDSLLGVLPDEEIISISENIK